MDGILLIDKPTGWTSFDVVAKVRGLVRQAGVAKPKVGHTGTLDPLATGLVVIVLGSYCKRAQEFSKLDKTYEVTARLGQTSTTGDEEGVKTVSKEQGRVSEEALQAALQKFTGEIQQIPPAYSAIKVNGQRAYKLARAGQEVKLQPRTVIIHSITEVEYHHPELSFTTHVSSGTYIRTLVEDIGQTLGTGAYTTHLRRASVGPYLIEKACQIDQLKPASLAQVLTI